MQNIISLIFRYFLSLFPACAGVIPSGTAFAACPPAFPRMCGGDPVEKAMSRATKSFSPHVRG